MTFAHDRYCPLVGLPDDDCQFCADLAKARAETTTRLNETWQQTLRNAELRGYERGWQDGANGKPAAP